MIAVLSMLCDHFCCVFITTSLHPLRMIGRLAFPIFAFLIAEGASKTRHIYRYFGRLFVFALLSEVPFDLAFSGKPWDLSDQNVFFTLFFGLFVLWALLLTEEKGGAWRLLALLPLAAASAGAIFLSTDYNIGGVLCITAFYLARRLRDDPQAYALALCGAAWLPCIMYADSTGAIKFFTAEMLNVFAVPLLLAYDGERGRRVPKYAFYAVYPAHLLLFAAVNLWILK